MLATEAEHINTIERQAAEWRALMQFISDTCEDQERTFRIGAEAIMRITANEDDTFTLQIESA